MENLQVLLRAIFCETVRSTEPRSLSKNQQSKLSNAAAHLWTKLQRRKNPSVFQTQIAYLQAVTQATSDDVCWKKILDELLVSAHLDDLSTACVARADGLPPSAARVLADRPRARGA